LFQKKVQDDDLSLHIVRKTNTKNESNLECNYLPCNKPYPKKEALPFKHPQTFHGCEIANQKDLIWISSNMEPVTLVSTEQNQLSWGEFNSVITNCVQKVNVATIAPLLRESPTNYSTFYTVIMRAKAITDIIMGPGYKTIISFDLQLYDMAMKLWFNNPTVKSNFFFRPGELHTVFWALQSLGKYISGSGLDQAWIEAGEFLTNKFFCIGSFHPNSTIFFLI
jgi:hypothetical protein